MVWLQALGLGVVIPANLTASYFGYRTRRLQQRDLLLPLCATAFTFYPLVISLPEAHFKLINYAAQQQGSPIDEDSLFPLAFLICLLTITLSTLIDKFIIKDDQQTEEENNQEQDPSRYYNKIGNPKTLKALLSLSIVFQNIVNYYFICIEKNSSQSAKEIFLFLLFSLFINFSHAYLLGLAEVDPIDVLNFCIFMNCGLVAGWVLGLFLQPDVLILSLLCVGAGMQLYCSVFICFAHIFTNGEKPTQDRTRYCSILIGFLLTVLYYPVCYLLRI